MVQLSSISPNPTNNGQSFDLTPEQSYFARSKHKYVGYVSGVGAGKTFAGIARTLLNMERWNPGEMGAIVAPTRTMVLDVIISEMRELGIFDGGAYEFNSSYSEEPGIHGPHGSRALILSADNRTTVERLKGLNLAWWWMDEEAEIDPRAREILMQRLRTGDYRNGFITTTPKGRNHTFDFFVGDQDAEQYEYGAGVVYETDDRTAITGVPTYANPHTPEDYHEAMADLPEEVRAQEVEGRFVEFGGGMLPRDMLEFVHVSEMPEEREFSWTVAADLAVEADAGKAREDDTDYWAAAVIAYDALQQQAYLVDVTRTRGMTKDQGVGWLSSIMDGLPTNQIGVEANQAQRWLVQDLRNSGLQAYEIKNTRSKEERLTYLSVPFANESVKVVNHDDPEDRPHNQEYDPRWQAFVNEWVSFPTGSHDDLLDATEMALRDVSLGAGVSAIEAGSAYGNG